MTVVLAAAASTSTSWINLDDLWKIIVLGIICGAGWPAPLRHRVAVAGPALRW